MPAFLIDLRKSVQSAQGGMDLRKAEWRPARSEDHPMARHSPAKVKLGLTGKKKVGKVMEEYKEGALHSGSGAKVTSRKQAIAIGMSEGRRVSRKKR